MGHQNGTSCEREARQGPAGQPSSPEEAAAAGWIWGTVSWTGFWTDSWCKAVALLDTETWEGRLCIQSNRGYRTQHGAGGSTLHA